MSVPADLAEMSDDALRRLEAVAAADPEASVEALARLHVHLLAEWRRRALVLVPVGECPACGWETCAVNCPMQRSRT